MNSAQSKQVLQDEEARLKALGRIAILDTSPDKRFDRIVRVATKIFSTPAGGLAFVDKDRVWYKSLIGLQRKQVERLNSFEDECIVSRGSCVVENASIDDRFKKNILVSQEPNIKFYAGVPLRARTGEYVGVLFICDRISRKFTENEQGVLDDLAVWAELETNYKAVVGVQSITGFKETKEELARKNRELQEAKAKNDAILENIGDGIISINSGGEILYLNEQAEKLLEMSSEKLKGTMLIHTVNLVDDKGVPIPTEKRPIRTALLSKKRVESRGLFYVRRSGVKFPVAITATPVVLFNQVVGGVNVFRDITREYEVDKMKTEFISLASHQLRTPLSAMKWFSEILLDGGMGELSKEATEVISNIYQSNERMIELVNTLLNISRIESGRIIVDPKPTDLKILVEEVVKELEPKIKEKKHHLVVSVHHELPKISVDPNLVRHVYMNLLTNAIKYTPTGGEISVMISKSGNEVISQVSDSGYGIPKEQQEKVFKRFFRAKNIAKVETDGTGLGLYLAKAIVDSSGGKIWFESSEGKGTTFWFILPQSGSKQREGEVSLDS